MQLKPWARHTAKTSPQDQVTTYICTQASLADHVEQVRSCLTENLRKKEYRNHPNPVAGHCYVASEVLYHKLGGKGVGWTPQTIRHEGGPHWYLKNLDGRVIDPTADQFESPVPYAQGKGCGFLTRQPSQRAQRILDQLA